MHVRLLCANKKTSYLLTHLLNLGTAMTHVGIAVIERDVLLTVLGLLHVKQLTDTAL